MAKVNYVVQEANGEPLLPVFNGVCHRAILERTSRSTSAAGPLTKPERHVLTEQTMHIRHLRRVSRGVEHHCVGGSSVPLMESRPSVLLLIESPHGTVMQVMDGLGQVAAEWTSTWQMEWQVGGTLRGRMVMPDMQY